MTMVLEANEVDLLGWLRKKKAELSLEFDKDLANKLGLFPETLSNILTGKRPISAAHVNKIIDNLSIKRHSPEYWQLLELAHFNRAKFEATGVNRATGSYEITPGKLE